ncbi:MAG: GNAT family N-acetyltransferase [Actinobacteria bacterium]|nr:GNAT family N-acetyltransferase [Actinomycetota bacterium]
MKLDTGSCTLRPWLSTDRDRLAAIANDRRIWRNMTDLFPHPYTIDDAADWIAKCSQEGDPQFNFAIVVESAVVGGIGAHLLTAEQQHAANVGYWLAPNVWGRGVATEALRRFTRYVFDTFAVNRLYATVFGWNPASARVLEKCGFRLEGRLREAIVKEGHVTDLLEYGLLRGDL